MTKIAPSYIFTPEVKVIGQDIKETFLEIRFRNNKLEKQYTNHREAEKAYPREVARKYIQRINIIKKALTINDLVIQRILRCHPLTGNRKGLWAIKLTGYYRLLFSLEGDQLEIVRIEKVSKHYEN